MKKLVIIAILGASLGGCATQFGQRLDPAIHPHRYHIVKKAPEAPAALPAPVIVQAPAPIVPAPDAPKSFWERHPLKWLHD